MSLTTTEVKKIAQLARLNLSEVELDKYTDDLSGIFEYIDQLNEVDTTGVAVTAQSVPLVNVFREDEAKKSGIESELVECSSLPVEKNQVKVKAVM